MILSSQSCTIRIWWGKKSIVCTHSNWNSMICFTCAGDKATFIFKFARELLEVSLLVENILCNLVLWPHLSSLHFKLERKPPTPLPLPPRTFECCAKIPVTLYKLRSHPFLWSYRNTKLSSLGSLYKLSKTYCKWELQVWTLCSLKNWCFILRKKLMDFIPKLTIFCRTWLKVRDTFTLLLFLVQSSCRIVAI